MISWRDNMKQKLIIVFICVVVGWIWLFPRSEKVDVIDQGKVFIPMIKIELSGAIEMPGIYHQFEPITVKDALRLGGEVMPDANLNHVNLSEIITKDIHIHIPSMETVNVDVIKKINVNKASFKELITIPGMTETRAASLIIYREAHGNFKHLDDLIHVKHIGVATLEKIKPYLTL